MGVSSLEAQNRRGLGPSGFGAEHVATFAADSTEIKLAKTIGESMSGKILCPRKCVDGQALSDIVVKNV